MHAQPTHFDQFGFSILGYDVFDSNAQRGAESNPSHHITSLFKADNESRSTAYSSSSTFRLGIPGLADGVNTSSLQNLYDLCFRCLPRDDLPETRWTAWLSRQESSISDVEPRCGGYRRDAGRETEQYHQIDPHPTHTPIRYGWPCSQKHLAFLHHGPVIVPLVRPLTYCQRRVSW